MQNQLFMHTINYKLYVLYCNVNCMHCTGWTGCWRFSCWWNIQGLINSQNVCPNFRIRKFIKKKFIYIFTYFNYIRWVYNYNLGQDLMKSEIWLNRVDVVQLLLFSLNRHFLLFIKRVLTPCALNFIQNTFLCKKNRNIENN